MSVLASRQKYRSPRQSFALVVVLAMVVLLTVTLVAIYTFLTSDIGLSSANENLEQARANARLGLNLAIEQLQELAGPDQRVTATADLLSTNGYSGIQPNALRKHWTGVWNTSSYSVRTPGTKYFLGWLVSGTNGSGCPAMVNSLGLCTNAPGSTDVTLVGANTVDTTADPTAAVTVPLVATYDEKGRVNGYTAWWTGDEGVKARMNMPTATPYATGTSTFDQQNFMAAAQNLSQRQVGFTNGSGYFANLSGTTANLNLSRTLLQLGLLDTAGNFQTGVYERWHDITAYSAGILSDTVSGGLRLDLTSLFGNAKLQSIDSADPTTSYGANGAYSSVLEQQPMFFISTNDIPVTALNSARLARVGPLWDVLARYYRLYDSWNWNGTSFKPRGSSSKGIAVGSGSSYVTYLSPHIYLQRENAYLVTLANAGTGAGSNPMYSRFDNQASSINVGPVVTLYQLAFLVGATAYPPVQPADPPSYYLQFYMQPIVVLWNPYDVPLATDSYEVSPNILGAITSFNVGSMGITNTPGMILMQNSPGTTPYSPGFFLNFTRAGGATTVGSFFKVTTSFLPGESKAFTIGGYQDWDAGSGAVTNLVLPATNVWSSIGGAYFNNINVTNSWVPTGGWTYGLVHTNAPACGWSTWPPIYNSSSNTTNYAPASAPVTVSVDFSCFMPDPVTPPSNVLEVNAELAMTDSNVLPFQEWYAGAGSPVYTTGNSTLADAYWTFPLPLSTSSSNYKIQLAVPRIDSLVGTPQPIGALTVQLQPGQTGFTGNGAYNCSITSANGSPMIATPFANSSPRALYGIGPSIDGQYGNFTPQSAPFLVSVKQGSSGLNIATTLAPNGGLDGYFGEGVDSASGTTSATLFSIPSYPMLSIGQFQHVPLSFHVNEPSYPIGNSRIPDYFTNALTSFTTNTLAAASYQMLPPPGTALTGGTRPYYNDPLPVVDVSWYLNSTIWDHYFLSSVPTAKQIADGFFTSFYPGQTFNNAYVAANKPLPNSRMQYYWRNGAAPATTTLQDYQQAAANLMITGAFNVNSTSVEAWKAELASLNGGSITTTSGSTITGLQNPVSRLMRPNDQNNNGSSNALFNRWNYFTQLSDAQIQTLAQDIVAQVKLRGPFSSLGEFVNRALANVDPHGTYETRTSGALQAAIDNSGINSSFNTGNMGAPTAVSQGDLLQYLAPILAARSDTFIVRAYGESDNPATGTVRAKAWCEAIVQRVPDYLNSADNAQTPVTSMGSVPGYSSWGTDWVVTPATPATLNSSLSTTSQTFGRRFRIIAFRWLNENDI